MACECILLKPALRFLEEQVKPSERKQILEIIESICGDPFVNGKTKFLFPAPPAVFNICKVEGWWVIYYRPRPCMIHIVNVGSVPERPDIRRP